MRVELTGKLRVCPRSSPLDARASGGRDLCHGPGSQPGGLAGDRADDDRVVEAGQAADVRGRLVFDKAPLLDIDVIHKPAQVFDPSDLGLLFERRRT